METAFLHTDSPLYNAYRKRRAICVTLFSNGCGKKKHTKKLTRLNPAV